MHHSEQHLAIFRGRMENVGSGALVALSVRSAKRCGVQQIEESDLFFRRQKRSLERISRQFAQMLVGKSECVLRQLILPIQRSIEHRRIVGIDREHQTVVKSILAPDARPNSGSIPSAGCCSGKSPPESDGWPILPSARDPVRRSVRGRCVPL